MAVQVQRTPLPRSTYTGHRGYLLRAPPAVTRCTVDRAFPRSHGPPLPRLLYKTSRPDASSSNSTSRHFPRRSKDCCCFAVRSVGSAPPPLCCLGLDWIGVFLGWCGDFEGDFFFLCVCVLDFCFLFGLFQIPDGIMGETIAKDVTEVSERQNGFLFFIVVAFFWIGIGMWFEREKEEDWIFFVMCCSWLGTRRWCTSTGWRMGASGASRPSSSPWSHAPASRIGEALLKFITLSC